MALRNKWSLIAAAVAVLGIIIIVMSHKSSEGVKMDDRTKLSGTNLALSSAAFLGDAPIPVQYTCKGQNINPPLSIMGVPAGAKSLALIMHDPDAVSGDFVHWTIWDIPTSTESIAVNSLPAGATAGLNGGGQNKYMGPCPPAGTGTHHYLFELYALDKTLGLPAGAGRDQLQKAMAGHTLAQHILTGLFSGD